jgi:hypothetical protein
VLDEMLAAGDGKFADVNCGWSGSPVKTLAVQCGQSFFVLLENDKTNSVSGSLSFPISTTNFYRVQLFDPEQNTTNTLNTLERGNATEKNISVPQMSCLVVVASLEK